MNDEFSLIDQPWLLVRRLDGQVEEVSLLQAFGQAHEIRELVGELPTQIFAITRLLLAILHRAVRGPVDTEHWQELWAADVLPIPDIADYLAEHRQRFELISGSTPFYQVADLHTSKNETFGLERLIADAPTGPPYLTTRLGPAMASISFGEAARWLVHCQAFDVSGIKSGAVGDPRVKGGKGYPIGVGWAGMIGGILCQGSTLRETLLLNLIAESVQQVFLPSVSAADLPMWERRPQVAAPEDVAGRLPCGPLDLYTWQSRRIRLVAHDGRICGVLICNGDKIEQQNRHDTEPMSVWRRSKPQESKLKQPVVYMPRTHDPERAFWRGLGGLLPSQTVNSSGKDADQSLCPALIQWISALKTRGLLDPNRRVRVRALGLQYINQQAIIGDLIDDEVIVSVAALTGRDTSLGAEIESAISATDQAVFAVRRLAQNLARAAGGEGDGPGAGASEVAYAELDQRFRTWLESLDSETEPEVAGWEWEREAFEVLRSQGRQLVNTAGPAALIGRKIKVNQEEYFMCTPIAEREFCRGLRHALPAGARATFEPAVAR